MWSGEKYLLRTDILYRRVNIDPDLNTEVAQKAFSLYRLADQLEADGRAMEAMETYRNACKMCPKMARVYGL